MGDLRVAVVPLLALVAVARQRQPELLLAHTMLHPTLHISLQRTKPLQHHTTIPTTAFIITKRLPRNLQLPTRLLQHITTIHLFHTTTNLLNNTTTRPHLLRIIHLHHHMCISHTTTTPLHILRTLNIKAVLMIIEPAVRSIVP